MIQREIDLSRCKCAFCIVSSRPERPRRKWAWPSAPRLFDPWICKDVEDSGWKAPQKHESPGRISKKKWNLGDFAVSKRNNWPPQWNVKAEGRHVGRWKCRQVKMCKVKMCKVKMCKVKMWTCEHVNMWIRQLGFDLLLTTYYLLLTTYYLLLTT